MIEVSDIKNAIKLESQSTYENYKLEKDGIVYGIKKYLKEDTKEVFKNKAFSEIYFLKKVGDKYNFPKFVKFLSDNSHIYIITEWCDSIILSDYMANIADPNVLINIFSQIFLILSYSTNVLKIVHGDTLLHNILLKKVEKKGSIMYTHMGKKYYFTNYGYIPVLWDFGLSRTLGKNRKAYFRIQEIINQEVISEKNLDFFKVVNNVKYTKNNWFYNYVRSMYLEYIESGIEDTLKNFTEMKNDVSINIIL